MASKILVSDYLCVESKQAESSLYFWICLIFPDGSYDDMLKDPNVEIVYVGNVTSLRRETGEKCLKANKHVLLEKPFACTVADGEYLMALAKERNLFIMEVGFCAIEVFCFYGRQF